jgi:hypothetical protein
VTTTTPAGWRPGFGRNVEHDPRSFNFPAARLGAPQAPTELHDVTFTHHGDVLDQDGVGACTAFTLGDLLHSAPIYRAARVRDVDRAWCFRAYALETTVDPFAGAWVFDGMVDGQPTGHGDDTGSSSLGMFRAGKQLGVISRVEWAFGLRHALEAMVANRRPGALGIPWRAAMMTPDSDGRIRYTGTVEGGHEIAALRLRVADERVYIFNHWLMPDGTPWGRKGFAWLSWDDLGQALEEQGDFAQFYAPWETPHAAG